MVKHNYYRRERTTTSDDGEGVCVAKQQLANLAKEVPPYFLLNDQDLRRWDFWVTQQRQIGEVKGESSLVCEEV